MFSAGTHFSFLVDATRQCEDPNNQDLFLFAIAHHAFLFRMACVRCGRGNGGGAL